MSRRAGCGGRTHKIGVVLCDLANRFLGQDMEAVNEVPSATSDQVLLGVGQSNMPVEACLNESMIDYSIDGPNLTAPRIGSERPISFARHISIGVIVKLASVDQSGVRVKFSK